MDKKYVILIINTFDDRIPSVYGTYTLEEAKEKIKKMYEHILEEWDEYDIYEGATIHGNVNEGCFYIDWGDETYTDYSIETLQKEILWIK